MKKSILITLCLAMLQSSIAQNENPTTEETLLSPSTSVKPENEPIVSSEATTEAATSTELPTTSTDAPTTPPEPPTSSTQAPEPITEATTIGAIEASSSAPNNKSSVKIVDKLSDQIRSILKQFQDSEQIEFSGLNVLPDPMPAPNASKDFGLATGEFYNLQVYGLSNFTVEAVELFLDEMQVYVRLRMKKLLVKGNVTVNTLAATFRAPFNMTLTNVTAEGNVHLKTDSNGKLYANKTTSDISYEKLEVGSSDLSLFKSLLDGAGVYVLTQIKPTMLNEIETRLNQIVNVKLEASPKIPEMVNRSPVDLAILEGRSYVRKNYEPFTLKNLLNHESEYLIVNIGPVTIHGLSKFARVGNITLDMKDGVVQLKARFITGRLVGQSKFYYDFGKVDIIRNSSARFVIDHLQVEAKLNQSISLKRKPVLDDLQLEAGRVRVKLDDKGDFDFLVELVIREMPGLLRHFITDSLEEMIKERIQTEVLDKINLEQFVTDNLTKVEGLLVY